MVKAEDQTQAHNSQVESLVKENAAISSEYRDLLESHQTTHLKLFTETQTRLQSQLSDLQQAKLTLEKESQTKISELELEVKKLKDQYY
jgi:polyhydroxyalkanoate synthesis regulator phasin